MAVETEQVVQSLGEFESQPAATGVERGSGQYMYWRRKHDGYIVVLPAWDTEYVRQIDLKRYEPLSRYGRFYLWNPEENWNVLLDPYRRLLRLGGAQEFPIEQIIELGWHRKPPSPGLIFPQLKGHKLTDVQCPSCQKWFSSERLLRKHEQIAHGEVAEVSRLARAWSQAAQQVQGPLAETLKLMIDELRRIAERQEVLEKRLARGEKESG